MSCIKWATKQGATHKFSEIILNYYYVLLY